MQSELKEYSYYNDLYDKFTINECRRVISDTIKKEESRDKPGERKIRTNSYELYVSFPMIDRALSKNETIESWISNDREKDKFIKSIKIPKIICKECSKLMTINNEMFMSGIGEEETDRILFIFGCEECNKRRLIYDNGEEKIPEKHLCPDCNIELEKNVKVNNEEYITTYNCKKCNFKKVENIDLSIEKEETDLNYESDRKRFCISEEKANELKKGIQDFYDEAYAIMTGKDPKSIRKREEERKYKSLDKLKIITHNELKEKLSKILTKEGYTDFTLAEPEVGDDIKVYFSVFNNSGELNTMKSNTKLRKLIKDYLNKTNWLLIDQGRFENRLGVIRGRLKGIDNKDKLLELITKNK